MSNDRFSRIRAFAGPNALEPSRNPEKQHTNIVRGVLEGLRIVTGYIPSSGTVTDPSRGFTSVYTGGWYLCCNIGTAIFKCGFIHS